MPVPSLVVFREQHTVQNAHAAISPLPLLQTWSGLLGMFFSCVAMFPISVDLSKASFHCFYVPLLKDIKNH